MDLNNLFFEEHPNEMLIYDRDTLNIVKVNKRFTETYGYTRSEAKKLTIEEIRPEEDIPTLHDKLCDLGKKEDKAFDVGTVRHQTKNGDILHVQIASQYYPIEGRNTRVVHIYNVTDTVELKNRYKKTLEELVHHIDENPLAMVKLDQDLKIIDWSKRAEEKLGYTAGEVKGKTPFDINIFPEEEHDFIFEHIGEILNNGTQKTRFETVALKKEGTQIHVKIHASALKSENNKLRTVVAFIENITFEKRIEQLFETTEEMAQIGGWEYNPNNGDLYWTDEIYRIYDFPMDKEINLEEAFACYTPEDKERIREDLENAIEYGATYDSQYQMVTAGGDKKWVRSMGRPVLRNGNIFRVMGILQDISEQKAKEKEITRNAEEKEVLLAEVHHRVKNNLAIISGLLELKAMEMDKPELTDVLRQSQLRIQSMSMIHEALYDAEDFSNLKFSKFVNDLVSAIENAQGYKQEDINISVTCTESLKLNVNQAIPCGLIINELVTNALKHAFVEQDEGKIDVTIETNSEDEVTLTVADNGKGLPEEFISGQITSLGATLIRQLTTQLEGELDIQNKDGALIRLQFIRNSRSGSSSQHFSFN
jgi:PAS domain S-box-containing protein